MTLKETSIPNCIPDKCDYTHYSNALTPFINCNLVCGLNENHVKYTYHNKIFVLFFWLAIISFIISIVFLIKERK